MRNTQKTKTVRLLVMYMVTVLLFLTSFELHIHSEDAAVVADHGAAVSISSIVSVLDTDTADDEIVVTPDSVLKVKQGSTDTFAVLFLLVAVLLVTRCRSFTGQLREVHAQLPDTPLHISPPLRAPPL